MVLCFCFWETSSEYCNKIHITVTVFSFLFSPTLVPNFKNRYEIVFTLFFTFSLLFHFVFTLFSLALADIRVPYFASHFSVRSLTFRFLFYFSCPFIMCLFFHFSYFRLMFLIFRSPLSCVLSPQNNHLLTVHGKHRRVNGTTRCSIGVSRVIQFFHSVIIYLRIISYVLILCYANKSIYYCISYSAYVYLIS